MRVPPFKIITTVEELREWMQFIHPENITDEMLCWFNCVYNAENILYNATKQELAAKLQAGIPSMSTLESLQETLDFTHENKTFIVLHTLYIQETAARVLGHDDIAEILIEKTNEINMSEMVHL